jgi:hypothetical protein
MKKIRIRDKHPGFATLGYDILLNINFFLLANMSIGVPSLILLPFLIFITALGSEK